MKKIKIKWKKNGEEIDAYVNISRITVEKNKYPVGRGEGIGSSAGPSVPPDYGSIVEYHISEDAEGKVVISRGQMVNNFDIDGTESIQDFAKNTLKKNKHLKDMKDEE